MEKESRKRKDGTGRWRGGERWKKMKEKEMKKKEEKERIVEERWKSKEKGGEEEGKGQRKRGEKENEQKKTGSGLKEAEFFTRSPYRPIRVQKHNFCLLMAS